MPNMLQRIGIGFVVLIVVVIILAIMTAIDVLLHLVAIAICLFIFAVGEVLSVTAGEQSVYDFYEFLILCIHRDGVCLCSVPQRHQRIDDRSLLFFNKIGRTLALVIVLFIRFHSKLSDIFWYNIVVLIITVPGFFIYLWIAIRYKRRRWDDEAADEDNVTYENALEVLRMQMNTR